MEKKIRIVHFLNSFFGGATDRPIMFFRGSRGPGRLLEQLYNDQIEVVATAVGNDDYCAENLEQAVEEIIALLEIERVILINDGKVNFDIFVAGPAFNAGRYGMACGALCQAVQNRLEKPAVTAMYSENPGVDQYGKSVYIVKTTETAIGMKNALEKMISLGIKLVGGKEVLPDNDHYFPRFRRNYFSEKTGAERAIDMAFAIMNGAFNEKDTEYEMPKFDRVAPALPIVDLAKTKIALVTSGGIVPKGNPDKIEASSAQKFGEYVINKDTGITAETYVTAHGGYDGTYANAEPNRILPVDAMLDLEKESIIGELYGEYFATVGNGTSVGNAKKFGQEIAKRLVADGVQAVILTST